MYFIHPQFFGHNFGSVLMNFVQSSIAGVGYTSMFGPVQHTGLDFYMTFVVANVERPLGTGQMEDTTTLESPVAGVGSFGYGQVRPRTRKMGVRGLWLYY